jgi:glycosyltransferase involved in cell wall biosynthesis
VKFLILTHNISAGGAATACRRLIAAFKHQEIPVELISVKEWNSPYLLQKQARRIYFIFLSKLDIKICRLLSSDRSHWLSSGLIGSITASSINVRKPSVVNVHWIGHATISIRQLSKIECPIIITMHDEWWIEEISHYKIDKARDSRNPLKKRILKHILQQKIQLLTNEKVRIVCLSSEMKEKIAVLLPSKTPQIYVIPNPVNAEIFRPLKSEVRNDKTILFAGGLTDNRKGFDLLENILNSMKEPCLVKVPGLGINRKYGLNQQILMKHVSKINDEREMNLLYNQSDICIVPSRQEALPQVATEALMTGTPVACFDVGGLRDIVRSEFNGIKIENLDTTKMAHCLDQFLLHNKFDRTQIAAEARSHFSEDKVVKAYLGLVPASPLK